MLLIDALYVCYGGALGLLRYLVRYLQQEGRDFYLLYDARCGDEFGTLPNAEKMVASLSNRRKFYRERAVEFCRVLCFSNIPPPVKLEVPVSTYFHNINMLTLEECASLKQKLLFTLKRGYIRHLRRNTDRWFVQTTNTEAQLRRHFSESAARVKLFPFYDFPRPAVLPTREERTDYVFVGEYSGSKGHRELLQAWVELYEQGLRRTLHLTCQLGPADFMEQLNAAIAAGVSIVNHGFVSREEVQAMYLRSKATIYPSRNESLGLGLVEALECGCDVIASDRAFTYAVCEPSEVFDPLSADSIVDAVRRYEANPRKSELRVRDMVREMVEQLYHAGA